MLAPFVLVDISDTHKFWKIVVNFRQLNYRLSSEDRRIVSIIFIKKSSSFDYRQVCGVLSVNCNPNNG